MLVPRTALERYSSLLDALCSRSVDTLMTALDGIDWARDVASVREDLVRVMEASCGASATIAARLAADFYMGMRALAGISDGFRATVDPRRDPKATEGAVRGFVQELVDGSPQAADKVRMACADRLDGEVRRAANRCVEGNARRDPRKPKWARVPMGAETCEFCIMLASRGFKFHSEDMASHSHANCDCRVVPGFDADTTIDGYDPRYYKDCYAHPDRHPEIRDAVNARRRELYAERRAAEDKES